VFAPNFKHRERIVPRRTTTRIDSDKPRAPLSWMQHLKRVAPDGDGYGLREAQEVPQASRSARAIDIETCPECGGKLRVIACTRHGFTRALLGLPAKPYPRSRLH
jgi:hypothetical protein